MRQYHDLLKYVLENGERHKNRTGTDTLSVFSYNTQFDLRNGFPLLTTKKLNWKGIVYELLWFLRGEDNVRWLWEHNVRFWDPWADETGYTGPLYGPQWRSWPAPDGRHIDQLANVIGELKTNPDSRRLIVSAWNVADLKRMKLPPCHLMFQFYFHQRTRELSCHLLMRSADSFIGVPFNIASYALLLMMVAQVTDFTPRALSITFVDLHLYINHVEGARLQLSRAPKPLPRVTLNPSIFSIDDFTFEDITLEGYDPDDRIKVEVAV